MRRLKEFVKEQLVSIPTVASYAPMPAPPVPQPTTPAAAAAALTDPGAMLAGLL